MDYIDTAVQQWKGSLDTHPMNWSGRSIFTTYLPPEVREDLKEAVLAAFERRETFRAFVNPNVHKNGEIVILETSGTPVLDKDGNLLGYRGCDADITERRKAHEELLREITERESAERALRQSEERFRTVADFAYDWEYWIDLDGNFVYVSPSCKRITGYAAGEFMDNPGLFEEIVHPDDSMVVRKHLLDLKSEKDSDIEPLEFRIVDRAGKVRWIEHMCRPVYSEGGQPLGRRASQREITERKEAQEALRTSEEFNRRLVEHAPVGIVYLAEDGTVEYANPAAHRIAGLPESQGTPFSGWNIAELPGLHDRSKVQEGLRRLVEGASLSGLEVPYKTSIGLETVLLVAATPRFSTDGTVTGAILMFTDISEHKRAEELQRQTARYRAVADLAGGVAHNFNNLLQIVIGYLELALMDLEMGNYT